MNFDIPQPRPWEDKKSLAFREWLFCQVNLSPGNRSRDFQEYIDIKSKESAYQRPGLSIEEKRNETFTRYLDGLGLTENELKEKSIMDVGCHEGEFVVSCIEKGITREAYGMDINLEGDALNNKYDANFFSKNFTDESPVNGLDYVVSVGALSLYFNKDHKAYAEEAIVKSLGAINEKGEIRIWPIGKSLQEEGLDGVKEEERIVSEIMGKLEKELDIAWELRPTNIRVSGTNKDVWAEQVLIIKHRNASAYGM